VLDAVEGLVAGCGCDEAAAPAERAVVGCAPSAPVPLSLTCAMLESDCRAGAEGFGVLPCTGIVGTPAGCSPAAGDSVLLILSVDGGKLPYPAETSPRRLIDATSHPIRLSPA
jgi:hypothetical protein